MSRILDTILPESVHNEGPLFVPQVLEDLMRGKLDAEFPPKLDEGDDPASVTIPLHWLPHGVEKYSPHR